MEGVAGSFRWDQSEDLPHSNQSIGCNRSSPSSSWTDQIVLIMDVLLDKFFLVLKRKCFHPSAFKFMRPGPAGIWNNFTYLPTPKLHYWASSIMFDLGQWHEIERISGVPFRRSQSQRKPESGVDAELEARYRPHETSPLAIDFHLANISDATKAEVGRLQRDLLAVEIESGSERERNRALEEQNANYIEQLRELNEELQARSQELSDKEEKLRNLVILHDNKKQTEAELMARINGLENKLVFHEKAEEELRFEQSTTANELEKSRSRIAMYEERVHQLQGNLNDTIQLSKENESKAVARLQSEAKQNAAILEAKLQSTNDQLLKAEEREQQASLRVEEARREASCTLENMYKIISNERKELKALYIADVERINLELDSTKQRLLSLNEEIQEANRRLAKQSEKSTMNLNEAEIRMKEIKCKLGSQSALCEKLQGELGQVSDKRDTSLSMPPIIHRLKLLFNTMLWSKSAEQKEMLEGCIVSLNEKIKQLETSKNSSDQFVQALKATLDEERYNHASFVNNLEKSLMDFVREKFKCSISSTE